KYYAVNGICNPERRLKKKRFSQWSGKNAGQMKVSQVLDLKKPSREPNFTQGKYVMLLPLGSQLGRRHSVKPDHRIVRESFHYMNASARLQNSSKLRESI